MVDLTLDRDNCPRCGKLLDVLVEFHGDLQCWGETCKRAAKRVNPFLEFINIKKVDNLICAEWLHSKYRVKVCFAEAELWSAVDLESYIEMSIKKVLAMSNGVSGIE